jgi:hypothetical protein
MRVTPYRSAAILLSCMLRRVKEPGDIVAHPRGDESLCVGMLVFKIENSWACRDFITVHRLSLAEIYCCQCRFGITEIQVACLPNRTLSVLPNRTLAGLPKRTLASLPNRTLAGLPKRALAGLPKRTLAGSLRVACGEISGCHVTVMLVLDPQAGLINSGKLACLGANAPRTGPKSPPKITQYFETRCLAALLTSARTSVCSRN